MEKIKRKHENNSKNQKLLNNSLKKQTETIKHHQKIEDYQKNNIIPYYVLQDMQKYILLVTYPVMKIIFKIIKLINLKVSGKGGDDSNCD